MASCAWLATVASVKTSSPCSATTFWKPGSRSALFGSRLARPVSVWVRSSLPLTMTPVVGSTHMVRVSV